MKDKTKKLIVLLLLIFTATITITEAIPKGNIFISQEHQVPADSVEFLYDLTYNNTQGNIVYEQQIFDRAFEMINNAEKFIILDMFLFGTDGKPQYRNLTDELTDTLIKKKQQNKEIPIYFITDYFNLIYNNYNGAHFTKLEQAGINIIYISPNQINPKEGLDFITHRLKLFKLRLNHKKLIITDNGQKISSLITSANPHDPSSPNSNTAIYTENKIWKDIYESEKTSANFSDKSIEQFTKTVKEKNTGEITIQYLTDGGSLDLLEKKIQETKKGDSIKIATFMLADGRITKELLAASEREVDIKIILDQNIESFGKKKRGFPNKIFAKNLIRDSEGKIQIKWYETNGEQFHTKTTIIQQGNTTTIFTGSSNLTPKKIFNYNLESDIKIIANKNTKISQDTTNYFNRIWSNENGTYTKDYS